MNKQNAWQKLQEYIDEHPYTVMTIEFKDGAPHLAEEVKESIKFT